ncbi:MAG: hypothetical protein LBU68_00625 [Rickettsiales bacterium]|nr:hypothetical protein [Rickettsiales bacterium]
MFGFDEFSTTFFSSFFLLEKVASQPQFSLSEKSKLNQKFILLFVLFTI